MRKLWIISICLFFSLVSASFLPLWSYQLTKPPSLIAGTPDEVLVASNAFCHYENEPSGGTYEICDGNASLIYLKNGKFLWSLDKLGDFIISVDMSDDSILIGVQNKSKGIVYLFNRNGSLKWRREISWINFAALSGKRILAGSSGGLFAFDSSGRVLWRKRIGNYFAVSGDGKWVLSWSFMNKTLYLLENGKKALWVKTCYNVSKMFISQHGDLILVASSKIRYGLGRNITLTAFNRNGTLLWQRTFKDMKDAAISNEGHYVGIITPRSFYLVNSSGAVLWKKGIRGITAASVYDGLAAAGTSSGKVYVFNIVGEMLGDIEVDGKISAIIISEKELLVASTKGVYSFQLKSLTTTSSTRIANKTSTAYNGYNSGVLPVAGIAGLLLMFIFIVLKKRS